jgi:hypothetical protein
MSGRKYSDFQLRREREQKLRLVQGTAHSYAEAQALVGRITATLGSASDGLRSTFPHETKKANEWLQNLRLGKLRGYDTESDLSRLREAKTRLDRIVTSGREIQTTLLVAFTQKADVIGKRLAKHLAETEQLYLHHEALLRLWFGEPQTKAWSETLQAARHLSDNEQYPEAERIITALRQQFTDKGVYAETQENKHQKRLYLLKAIRQVCADMGFKEMSPPRYEYEEDRGSRIVLKVDTLDRGHIEFMLSLDSISSWSELSEGRCFEEFGQLSQFLESEFGIQTQFKMADCAPVPKLKQKGELHLPSDTAQQTEA